jgi:hypothetical protein
LFIWDLFICLTLGLIAINFPLTMVFALCHRFWQVVFSFSLDSRNFLTYPLFLRWPTGHSTFNSMLFNLRVLEYFL